MTYTHCRGCGIELNTGLTGERLDGLCTSMRGREKPACFGEAYDFAVRLGLGIATQNFNSPEGAGSKEWSVAIDQWLEATR